MSEGTERQGLKTALQKVRKTIKQTRDRKGSIGEEATKTALISPVLAALGWDMTDLDEVYPEYKYQGRGNPVDYALFVERSAVLFVEAKSLDTNLDDHKWQAQTVNYANTAGVKWCVLTDGDRYSIYYALAPGDIEQKRFCSICVSETEQDEQTLATLELLSKEKLIGTPSIEVEWERQFIDRHVEEALRDAFDSQDSRLVNTIRKRKPDLVPSQIRGSLKRAEIIIDFPASSLAERTALPETGRKEPPPSTETSAWGPRSYRGPLLRDGNVIVLEKLRPLLGKVDTKRVSIGHIHRTAEAAHGVAQSGAPVTCGAIRKWPSGPTSWGPTQRALGALYVAGAIVFSEAHHEDHFEIKEGLDPDGMIEMVLSHAQPVNGGGPTTSKGTVSSKQQFKWLLDMDEGGTFTINCRYLPDETKNFKVQGERVPPEEDFKPARTQLFKDIYAHIKPLFPDLPDGRVRSKAWAGVHKVYPGGTYGNK